MKAIISVIKYVFLISLAAVNYSCSPSVSVVQTAVAQTQNAYTSTPSSTSTPIETSTPRPLPTITPTNTMVVKNIFMFDTYSVYNDCEFQIQEITFAKKVLPNNTYGYYTYYEAKTADSILLEIVMSIKNLGKESEYVFECASVKAVYANKYTYTGFEVLDDNQGGFTFGLDNIAPLQTVLAHYIIEVPNEVQYSSNPLQIIVEVSGHEYIYKYR